MDQALVEQAKAENALRQQHKYNMRWSKADQRDQNKWEHHDSHPQTHKQPYGICKLCHWTPSTWGEDSE